MISTNQSAVSGWIWTNERSPLCTQARGASQFFKDAWEGTDAASLPEECPESGQADGKKGDF